MTDEPIVVPIVDAEQYHRAATQCEIALFDNTQSCDVTDDTKRHIVGGTNVWLCGEHADIINVTPIAVDEQA